MRYTNAFTRPVLLTFALLLAPAAFGQQTKTEAALLHKPIITPGGQFGVAAEVHSPWAMVGDVANNAVFFYRRLADGWKPAGMDRGPVSSWFGHALSSDGHTLVVGAFSYGWPNPMGHARVYELVDDRWKSIQDVDPPGFLLQGGNPIFGWSVAVDGDVMVIGAPGYDLPIEKAGLILIYERIDVDWCWVAEFGQETLDGPSGHPGQHIRIGGRVAVSGRTIAASAQGQEGCVYLFERDAGAWRRTAMLYEVNPPDLGLGFGSAIALSEDERTLVVGQPNPDSVTIPFGYIPGRAHVFEKDDQGNWARTAVLHASDEYVGSDSSTKFGCDLDIEGNRIVVGSFNAKGNPSIPGPEGAVYLFERLPNGTWPATETRRWFASEPQNAQDVGQSVAIDQGFVVAGSFDRPAHVFEVAVGSVLCASGPNSTGHRGRLTSVGGPTDPRSFTLSACDCPVDRPGVFLASFDTGRVALGDGVLCLGQPIVRLGGLSPTGRTGTAFHTVNAGDPIFSDGLGAGTTLHVQYWFSDTVGAGANLTNAVSVTLE